ncbi:hypothetical protein M5K25_002965 [Dendrobium thyrsiflorum]|uniref:Uncharacterized protein n=1 Tax=Dendrobium thyrsiflorum TaxID=117978 RepID=A0ABD0VWC0_DENTH
MAQILASVPRIIPKFHRRQLTFGCCGKEEEEEEDNMHSRPPPTLRKFFALSSRFLLQISLSLSLSIPNHSQRKDETALTFNLVGKVERAGLAHSIGTAYLTFREEAEEEIAK